MTPTEKEEVIKNIEKLLKDNPPDSALMREIRDICAFYGTSETDMTPTEKAAEAFAFKWSFNPEKCEFSRQYGKEYLSPDAMIDTAFLAGWNAAIKEVLKWAESDMTGDSGAYSCEGGCLQDLKAKFGEKSR